MSFALASLILFSFRLHLPHRSEIDWRILQLRGHGPRLELLLPFMLNDSRYDAQPLLVLESGDLEPLEARGD